MEITFFLPEQRPTGRFSETAGPMIHHLLAVDYDGTLAHDGTVDKPTIDALKRLRDSGRHLVLVTGRRLESLLDAFPKVGLFQCVVAENGALLYWPETGEESALGDPPPEELLDALRKRGVEPLEAGRVIVATWSPHESAVLDAIHELGLELQIIFNKKAVMVLPTGVNKAVGLRAALAELGMSPKNAVGVGDAQNDESMLAFCGTSAAVANALPAVKKMADIRLHGERGGGVAELIDRLITDDLREVSCRPQRGIQYGVDLSDTPLFVPAFGESVLVVGGPGGGKSRFATSFWERLADSGYQTCIVDPEGDYQTSKHAIVVGTMYQPPTVEEVLQVIADPEEDCVVSLFSVPKEQRPQFFSRLLRALYERRGRMGRPHWIIVDEAHYVAPAAWRPAEELHRDELRGVMFISAFPDRVSQTAFHSADLVVAIGNDPRQTMQQCFQQLGRRAPSISPPEDRQEHHALAWHQVDELPKWFRRIPPRADSRRHQHHYFDGELEEPYRFRFRGPDHRLDLPAQNLRIFIQLAQGIDGETWEHHLRRGDYSRWIRAVIKDEELAAEVAHVERTRDIPRDRSREIVIAKIRERYDNTVL